MDLNDYTGLQASIAQWLHRADLTAAIPDFIRLAEARFNRNLRVRQMVKRATVDFAQNYADLPVDWLEFVSSPMSDNDQYNYRTTSEFDRAYYNTDYGRYFTIIGNQIYVGWDGASPLSLRYDYYAKIPALSADNATNWLLEDGPDAYLYGALLEAEPYLKNDARIATWQGFLQVALTDIQTSADKARFSGAPLTIGRATQ